MRPQSRSVKCVTPLSLFKSKSVTVQSVSKNTILIGQKETKFLADWPTNLLYLLKEAENFIASDALVHCAIQAAESRIRLKIEKLAKNLTLALNVKLSIRNSLQEVS